MEKGLKEVLLRTNKNVMTFQRGILTIKIHVTEFNIRTKQWKALKMAQLDSSSYLEVSAPPPPKKKEWKEEKNEK